MAVFYLGRAYVELKVIDVSVQTARRVLDRAMALSIGIIERTGLTNRNFGVRIPFFKCLEFFNRGQ